MTTRGKAPKLQPRNYKPEFVWDRVHNGFRGMPSWKAVYEPNEVLAFPPGNLATGHAEVRTVYEQFVAAAPVLSPGRR